MPTHQRPPRRGPLGRLASLLSGLGRSSARGPHMFDERFRLAVEAMPEGLAWLDRDGRYVLWNARYAELAFDQEMQPGTSFEAVLRTGVAKGLYPEAAGREEAWLKERLARLTADHGVHEQALRDGRWLRIEERRTADGGVIATLADITELKRKEASFRLMFENNPAPMWVHEVQTWRLLAVNEAAVRLFGRSREALLTMCASDLMPPDQAAELRARAAGAAERERYGGEQSWRFLGAGGQELQLLPHMETMTHEGRAARLVALWDVTDRLKAETELRRTRSFLNTVVDSLPAMLLVKDAREQRYLLWNRMAEELTGLPREQVLGKTVEDVFPADDAKVTLDRDVRVFDSGAQVLVHEGHLSVAGGGVLEVLTKRIAVLGPDGQPDFMVAIIDDITERNRANHALSTAWEEAEAANRAKSEFLANMSHEIRTPLNGVLALAGVLAGSELDTSQRELVEIIQSSAVTLERLLSDILDLARVESGRLEIVPEPFDLGAAVRDVAALCQLRAQQKGVAFELDIDDAARGWVVGDVVRVKQVLTNLLNNAVKFTDAGKVSLTVTCRPDGETSAFRFVVRDTGIGFSAEAKARLFSRFSQADGSITRRFGGSGLGLSICSELVRLMGGALDADSVEGEGSEFVVELALAPTSDQALTQEPGDGENQISQSGRRLRVLLAEDHPVNRRVVELILQDLEVDLTCAENGREAVEAFQCGGFDLVLMDMQMPVLDGLAAVREIRALERGQGAVRTPILMLSANAMPEHLEEARAAGSDGYVTKPVQPTVLLDEMNRALGAAPADTKVA